MRKPSAKWDAKANGIWLFFPADGATKTTTSGRGLLFDNNLGRNEWLTVEDGEGNSYAVHGIAMQSTGAKGKAKRVTNAELMQQLVALLASKS